jgi:hypothetical protein
MFQLTVMFKGRQEPQVFTVIGFTVHVYGFLELKLQDGGSQSYNLSDIHEFTYPTANNTPVTKKG